MKRETIDKKLETLKRRKFMKTTKRIQLSSLVLVLFFAFPLCSCEQGISQNAEQTEEQIQKQENTPTKEESKTEEERLFEEYMPFCKILDIHSLEGMSYWQLSETYNILEEKILDTEEILPEHLKEAEKLFHQLERFQKATEKTDYSLVDTLFPGKPNTFLYQEKVQLQKTKFLQKLLQEILNKEYKQFLKDNELWDRYQQGEEVKIPELNDPELEALRKAIADLAEYDKETGTVQPYYSFQREFIYNKEFQLEKRLEATDEGKKLFIKYMMENPFEGITINALFELEKRVNKNE